MYKYIFFGKIHPERVMFSIGIELPFLLEHHGFGMEGESFIKFENSSVVVRLESSVNYVDNDKCNLETLKNIVEENVRLIVDSFCYVNSYSYDVEITKVICDTLNLDKTFGVLGEWNIKKDPIDGNKEFTRILQLFDRSERIFFKDVLADFRRAIKYPTMTGSFCFRSIETIRVFYFEDRIDSDDKRRRKNGWKKLNEKFDLKECDFDEIKKFALPNRHGSYPLITYKERERMMNFTRKIIDKLIGIL